MILPEPYNNQFYTGDLATFKVKGLHFDIRASQLVTVSACTCPVCYYLPNIKVCKFYIVIQRLYLYIFKHFKNLMYLVL